MEEEANPLLEGETSVSVPGAPTSVFVAWAEITLIKEPKIIISGFYL